MAPPVATLDSPLRRGVGGLATSGADSETEQREETDRLRRGPGLELVFTVLFVLAGWWVGIRQLADNSFFWHLRTGTYMLAHGIPHGDIYSYTAPGTRWAAQSWLAERPYGALDRRRAPSDLRVLVA